MEIEDTLRSRIDEETKLGTSLRQIAHDAGVGYYSLYNWLRRDPKTSISLRTAEALLKTLTPDNTK